MQAEEQPVEASGQHSKRARKKAAKQQAAAVAADAELADTAAGTGTVMSGSAQPPATGCSSTPAVDELPAGGPLLA